MSEVFTLANLAMSQFTLNASMADFHLANQCKFLKLYISSLRSNISRLVLVFYVNYLDPII